MKKIVASVLAASFLFAVAGNVLAQDKMDAKKSGTKMTGKMMGKKTAGKMAGKKAAGKKMAGKKPTKM